MVNGSSSILLPVTEHQRKFEARFAEVVDYKNSFSMLREMVEIRPATPAPSQRLEEISQLMGTDANAERIDFLIGKLKEFGVTPFKQEFLCEYHWSEPEDLKLTMTSPYEKEITPLTPLLYCTETPEEGIEAELVDVDFGWEEDYIRLEESGVSVKGKIVLSNDWTTLAKSRLTLARLNGAIGVILINRYPTKYYGHQSGGQFGPYRVLRRARPAAYLRHRLKFDHYKFMSESLPGIPELVVTSEAGDMLRNLLKEQAVKVKMTVRKQVDERPTWNLVARIDGAKKPDEIVLHTAHTDAWWQGATDNANGCVALLETIRVLKILEKEGFRPDRTLMFGFVTGEENAMVGSTALYHGFSDLTPRIVYMRNYDGIGIYGYDFFTASGTMESIPLVDEVARSLIPEDIEVMKSTGAPGSGSDHAPFVYYGDIPYAAAGGWGGAGPKGPVKWYHGHENVPGILDPKQMYHPILVGAIVSLRFANSLVYPWDFSVYADALLNGVDARGGRQLGLMDLKSGAEKVNIDFKNLIKATKDFKTQTAKMNETVKQIIKKYNQNISKAPPEKDKLEEIREFAENLNSFYRYELYHLLRGFSMETDGISGILWPYLSVLVYPDLIKQYDGLEEVKRAVKDANISLLRINQRFNTMIKQGQNVLK